MAAPQKPTEEKISEYRLAIGFTPDERKRNKRLVKKDYADREWKSESEFVRHFFEYGLEQFEEGPKITLYKFDVAAPCGPWSDTATNMSPFKIPGEFAAWMGFEDEDWLVPCKGDSMVGADIHEGDALVMRPLYDEEPRHGDICLAQVTMDDATCCWTIKRWVWQNARVVLRDGNKAKMDLPPGARELRAIARKVGAINRGSR